jgi:hypothetical protein
LQFSGWNPVILKLTKLLLDIHWSGVKMEPLPGRIMGRKLRDKKNHSTNLGQLSPLTSTVNPGPGFGQAQKF